jgi:hypothetical protein
MAKNINMIKVSIAVLLLAGLLGSSLRTKAYPAYLRQAAKFGAKNCTFCHTQPTGGEGWNDRGNWLIKEKERRNADAVDVAWLAEYKEGGNKDAAAGDAVSGDKAKTEEKAGNADEKSVNKDEKAEKSEAEKSETEKTEKTEKTENKDEKAEKSENAEKGEKVEKVEKVEKKEEAEHHDDAEPEGKKEGDKDKLKSEEQEREDHHQEENKQDDKKKGSSKKESKNKGKGKDKPAAEKPAPDKKDKPNG